jgi:hypothetical protein
MAAVSLLGRTPMVVVVVRTWFSCVFVEWVCDWGVATPYYYWCSVLHTRLMPSSSRNYANVTIDLRTLVRSRLMCVWVTILYYFLYINYKIKCCFCS